jgi:hypothetical protein
MKLLDVPGSKVDTTTDESARKLRIATPETL